MIKLARPVVVLKLAARRVFVREPFPQAGLLMAVEKVREEMAAGAEAEDKRVLAGVIGSIGITIKYA